MSYYFNKIGLSHENIKKIINDELDHNADLLIGIDDPEVQEMINVLADVFAKAIEKNNEAIEEEFDKYVKKDDLRLR